MQYTYGWQSQPLISWKGPSTNSVTPSWSRGFVNGPYASTGVSSQGYNHQPSSTGGEGFWGKPRPMKHWRKQLNPKLPANGGSSGGRSGLGMPMDRPGGSVYLGADSTTCLVDCSNAYSLKENLDKSPSLQIYTSSSSDSFYDISAGRQVCVACNPENNVIKSGKTLLNKQYYTDSRAYLQSRNKRYTQNQGTGYDISGYTYFTAEGTPLWSSNNHNGAPYYYHPNCAARIGACAVDPPYTARSQLIYKPSNRKFATQGAVSSSSRITRLKLDTITRNGASLRTAWGPYGTNAGRYTGNGNAPYFIKSKNYNLCQPWRPTGNHTLCWVTPTGSVGQ